MTSSGTNVQTATVCHAMTNTDTKFKSFALRLCNGATLTGIAHIPVASVVAHQMPKPLLVGLHGATCSAYTWDVSPSYTASTASDMSGIPFVAFNRPNYLDSEGWIVDRTGAADTSQNSFGRHVNSEGYFAEEARWCHEYIFPALWTQFAVPNGCTAMVTTSHSMSVPATVIAAGMYASQSSKTVPYIWSGMILSGFGVEATQTRTEVSAKRATDDLPPNPLPPGQDSSIHAPPFSFGDKQDLMLGPEGLGDPVLRPLISQQTTPFLLGEIMDMATIWPHKAAGYQSAVRLRVLYGLGSHDWVWRANTRAVNEFLQGFTSSERVEGAVVQGASHAIELSPVSTGWWMRCCGWAIEVTESLEVQKRGIPVFP